MGILFRHIFVELVRVLAITTAVVLTVMAFGAAIKPLSENLVGPADLLRYMVYITVPMLQFALPFAGAFAGVIVYHRLTIDNEIGAMAASGISYRRMLMPAVVLGVLLTVVMLVLVDVGVPSFWQATKQIVAKDITRVFVGVVDRGEGLPFGGNEIYADDAVVTDAPPETGAAQRLILKGVVAVDLAADRMPAREFTAAFAIADVYRVGNNSVLKLALQDATVFNRGDRSIAGSTLVRPEAIDLGRTIEWGPKGLTFRQLMELREHLDRDPDVARWRDKVVEGMAAADAWKRIGDAARQGQPIRFRASAETDPAIYLIHAGGLGGTTLAGRGGPVTIQQYLGPGTDESRLRSEIVADRVTLGLVRAEADGSARFDVLANDATVRDRRSEGVGTHRPVRLAELLLESAALPAPVAFDHEALVAAARRRLEHVDDGPTVELRSQIQFAAVELEKSVKHVRDEIVARTVQRLSQALTAMVMLLSASTLAIALRNRTPLVVYLVAFVPAIIDILLVSGGEQMLRHNVSAAGIAVAFLGNALLALLGLGAALRIGRH